MIQPYYKATIIGLTAPLCWGMTVGLVKDITDSFGLSAGLAMLYGFICIFLYFVLGLPDIRKMPLKYLIFGIPLSNLCSIFFCISMYISTGGVQTVEVGMVNYAWPCLVVFLSVFINKQKARWWLYPGMLISFWGIMMVLAGDRGIDLPGIWRHVQENPWSYILAFLGALAWGFYSNYTKAWANGENPTLIIFAIDFIIFSIVWLFSGESFPESGLHGWISLVVGAIALGGAYAAWNYGISYGNMTILAIASYFTPVFSCLFASIWIGASLGMSLLFGVFVLVIGSIMSWSSTLQTSEKKHSEENNLFAGS